MKTLITGATGFVGPAGLRQLLAAGGIFGPFFIS